MNSECTFIIHKIWRESTDNEPEELLLGNGVNVLVGDPNTGKTKWTQLVDYILADPDPAEKSLGHTVSKKYFRGGLELTVGEAQISLMRDWQALGSKSKVTFNGEEVNTTDLQAILLGFLNIPRLKYPQGNPYSFRTWPELSFRTMLRHLYRQQRFWADIADNQFQVEQHACLLQFIGLADKVFPAEYALLVEKQKQLLKLEEQRNNFIEILKSIISEIVDRNLRDDDLNQDLFDGYLRECLANLQRLRSERDQIASSIESASEESQRADYLAAENIRLQDLKDEMLRKLDRTNSRISELRDFLRSLKTEANRIARTKVAGTLFSPIRVTVCPNCDQSVSLQRAAHDQCFVCLQPLERSTHDKAVSQRLEFEESQITAEADEVEELLKSLADEASAISTQTIRIDEELRGLQEQLRPYRVKSLGIPELSQIDVQIGQAQTKLVQLERINAVFVGRSETESQIDLLKGEIRELEDFKQVDGIDFVRPSRLVSDAMNEYLTKIRGFKSDSWTKGQIEFQINSKKFSFSVGGKDWKGELGGTLTLYFLLAYHYALLKLSTMDGFHIPGFCILDLVAEIEGKSVADKENFILIPFVELLEENDLKSRQILVTGSAFSNLKGAQRIELAEIW